MQKVKDVMSSPITVCTRSTTVREAEDIMNVKRVGALPVVREDKGKIEIVGIVTLIDLTGFEDKDVSVLQAMSGGIHTISQEEDLKLAARRMKDKHIHHLVVLDTDARIIGMLSSFDFVRMVAAQK